MPDPREKSNIPVHQSPTLSCSDTPKPGLLSPGQNRLFISRGYNLLLTRRQTGVYVGMMSNIC